MHDLVTDFFVFQPLNHTNVSGLPSTIYNTGSMCLMEANFNFKVKKAVSRVDVSHFQLQIQCSQFRLPIRSLEWFHFVAYNLYFHFLSIT